MVLALRMPTVTKFLCYFDLTTGGLIIGGFYAAIYGIVCLFLIVNMLSGMSIVPADKLNQFTVLGEFKKTILNFFHVIFFFYYFRARD
jgi:hypothetical protein